MTKRQIHTEAALKALSSLLANSELPEIVRLVDAGPQKLAIELAVNWVQKDQPSFSPDSQQSADGATEEQVRLDKAENVWNELPDESQRVLYNAVRYLSPGSERDVSRLFG
jgi:hypothetical protein